MHGLVKTLEDGDSKIKLVGNALTFIIYKSYFGRDLLNDIVAFAKNSADAAMVKKFSELNVRTAADIESLDDAARERLFAGIADYKFDTEFVLNFIAALMATAKYPEKPDVTDLIIEIPPHWLADKAVVTELMEFLSLFITEKKRVK